MYSTGFAMRLRPGAYPQYKHHHDHLWPEIAESMASNDVSMVILRHGEELMVHAVAPTEADWARSRRAPALARWGALMSQFLETDAGGDIAASPLEHAFRFGIFVADDAPDGAER